MLKNTAAPRTFIVFSLPPAQKIERGIDRRCAVSYGFIKIYKRDAGTGLSFSSFLTDGPRRAGVSRMYSDVISVTICYNENIWYAFCTQARMR